MSPSDGPLLPGKALARTYDHPSYADPWDCVVDYFDVLEYASQHPDAGRQAVGAALGLPPSRCRSWLEGSVPDPVRALQVADERGWLNLEYTDRPFRGMNVLTAWIFSGGSINQHYAPYFAVDEADRRAILDRAAAAVGVELDFTRSPAEAGRAIELRPVSGASILGRLLHILGAPVGAKNERTVGTLPRYLADAPPRIRQEFVQVYLENRGVRRSGKSTLALREERSRYYLDLLAGLLRELTGGSVSVSGKNVIVSASAAARIEDWPPVLVDGGTRSPNRQSGGF